MYLQELVRALAEDKADIHLDPVLYRACAVDLKGACKDVPRGNGRRKSVNSHVTSEIKQKQNNFISVA